MKHLQPESFQHSLEVSCDANCVLVSKWNGDESAGFGRWLEMLLDHVGDEVRVVIIIDGIGGDDDLEFLVWD